MYRPASLTNRFQRSRLALASALAVVIALLMAGSALPAWASTHPSPTPSPSLGAYTTVGVRTSGPHKADDRGVYHYVVAPGQAVIDYMAISNYSLHPVTVQVLPVDVSSSAGESFAAVAGKPRGSGSWIIPQETLIHLPKTSMQVVAFQLTVPRNATPGDHPAAILVSLLVKQATGTGHNVTVAHRVGLRIYLRVPGKLQAQLTIKNLRSSFQGSFTAWGFGHMVTDFDVVNSGNVTMAAKQVLNYTRSLGLSDANVPLKDLNSMVPGGSIHVHAQGKSMFAIANVDTHVSETSTGMPAGVVAAMASAKAGTFVFPWAWLVLLLVLIVLGYLARRWWKKHKAKKAAVAEARRIAEEPTGGKHRNGDPDPVTPVDTSVDPPEDPS